MRIKLRPLIRQSRLLLLAVLLLSPLCFVLAVSGDGLVAYPTNPDPTNAKSDSWFVYQLDRGQTKQDQLTVRNNSDQKQTVKIYAVDSTVNNVGEFALEAENDPRDDVGSWIKLESSSVELEPNQEKQIGFTISIPQDAAAGESSGGIIIQKEAAAADPSQSGFIITTRIGIRVYETVPGEVVRKMSFGYSQLTYDKEKKIYTLDVTIKNESNVSLEPDLKIAIKDTLFNTQNQQLEQKTSIPRAGEVKATFTFKKPKMGKFEITPEATYQKADGQQETVVATQKISFWALPWDEIIIIALLLIANLLFLLILKLLGKKEKKFYKSYRVRSGDNLETIAKRLGTDWKKIARINGFKPPYQIEADQIITVFDKRDMLEQLYMETEKHQDEKITEEPEAARPAVRKNLFTRLSEKLGISKNLCLLIVIGALLLVIIYTLSAGLFAKKNNIRFDYNRPDTFQNAPAADTKPADRQTESSVKEGSTKEAAATTGTAEKPDLTAADRARIQLEILNGSDIPGAASQASAALRALGYTGIKSGAADNSRHTETSLECAADIDERICSEIKTALTADHDDIDLQTSDRLEAGSIRIILGK